MVRCFVAAQKLLTNVFLFTYQHWVVVFLFRLRLYKSWPCVSSRKQVFNQGKSKLEKTCSHWPFQTKQFGNCLTEKKLSRLRRLKIWKDCKTLYWPLLQDKDTLKRTFFLFLLSLSPLTPSNILHNAWLQEKVLCWHFQSFCSGHR